VENRIEIWKDVLDFEDRYSISSLGRLFSKYKNKMLSPNLDKDGYKYITLYSGKGYNKFYRISRLVAINFIPNPDNLPQVNHKNHIKDDNSVDNLEWCQDYENQRKRSEFRGGKTSNYVGVRFHSEPNNWQARIGIKRKTYTLGLFKTEQEASEAYNKAYDNYYKNNKLPE
jgi:hypothetical protein